jgi:cytochrome P450
MTALATVRGPRFNPFDRQFRADPYRFYHLLREAEPVHRSLGMWVLTRYADVLKVLRDRTFLVGLTPRQIERQADKLGVVGHDPFLTLARQSIVFTDNPYHTHLRRIVGQAFTPQRLETFDPIIEQELDKLLDELKEHDEFDAISAFATQLPLRVLCRKLGVEPSMWSTIAAWTKGLRFLLEPSLLKRSDFARVQEILNDYEHYLRALIASRRADPGDDMISEWIAAGTDEDFLTEDELIHAFMLSFIAGHETSKGLIGNGLAALVDHPDQMDILRANPELMNGAVLEVMRWNAPLQQTKRWATEPAVVGDMKIEPGDIMLLCLGAANRDPEQFPDPDRFDVTRKTHTHLGFGFGMHICLGARLAEREVAAAFRRLLAVTRAIEAGSAERSRDESEIQLRVYDRLPIRFRY